MDSHNKSEWTHVNIAPLVILVGVFIGGIGSEQSDGVRYVGIIAGVILVLGGVAFWVKKEQASEAPPDPNKTTWQRYRRPIWVVVFSVLLVLFFMWREGNYQAQLRDTKITILMGWCNSEIQPRPAQGCLGWADDLYHDYPNIVQECVQAEAGYAPVNLPSDEIDAITACLNEANINR